MKENVYIVSAKRTAVGKFGGSLQGSSAPELAAAVIKNLIAENPGIEKKVGEVILGNVLSAGLGQNPARIASVKAGIPESVPAYTVNKVCGSGLKSITLASQAIELREADLIVAGGMENMSRSPYLIDDHRFGVKLGDQTIKDSMITDGLFCSLIGEHMGVTAENVAKKYKVSREDQDRFAFRSHEKALAAMMENRLSDEIVPVLVKQKKEMAEFKIDEQPRADTTFEALAKLKPIFDKDGTVTAGNSSSLNDRAAVIFVASEKFVQNEKIKPMARIMSYASVGLDPKIMGMGVYYAVVACLKKANFKIEDIDLWELNEAFASQSVAALKLLGIDEKIVNVNGGAIALGHPIGASGARILVSLIHELKRRKLKYGVASLCIGGGQGIAMLIENYE
ncbi:MAG: acetyl-CoA C-acetyltransferase [Patescibacteria group bacterium]|jgi:acetyl-CoA C-acetyltransferase